MTGNKKIIIDEYFNIRSGPKTITKDTYFSNETDFIDDNDNVLIKMEISGTLKYMTIINGFLIASPFSTDLQKKHA